jgi:hypothetical protein
MVNRFFSFLSRTRGHDDDHDHDHDHRPPVVPPEPINPPEIETPDPIVPIIEPEPIEPEPIEPEPIEPVEPEPEPLPIITYIAGPIIQPELHTLLLLFAGDFYNGHAEVQITLDDQTMFNEPHPVIARRDHMEQEVIIIRSLWAMPPQVSITFSNDLWEGTDDTDRNLFFYGGTYDGFQIPITHKFFRNGTIHFVPEIA